MMNLKDFAEQIAGARQRTAILNHYSRKSLVLQQGLLLATFEELYAVLQDLEVAQEELSQQNEQLAAACEVGELERDRYQKLFEFAPDVYLVTDVAGTIREVNRVAARLLNVPHQFLVGKPLAIFIPKEDRRGFRTKLNQLHFSQHQGLEWEVRLQPRGGEPINATLTATPIPHQEGRVFAPGWLMHITEHKQASEVVCLLSSAVQQAKQPIAITSAELDYPGPRYVFVNQAFTEMTGYTIEEITGKTPRILQGAKTDRSVLAQLRQNMSQGQLFYDKLINYHKDGSEYKVELSCAPIRNGQGDTTHFISIQRQIPLEDHIIHN